MDTCLKNSSCPFPLATCVSCPWSAQFRLNWYKKAFLAKSPYKVITFF